MAQDMPGSAAFVPSDTARPAILVVEDEWLLASELAQALAAGGYRVVGPAGAMQVMAEHGVDAALLDVNLGGDSRVFEVAWILRAQRTPFAFLTGYPRTLMPPDLREQPTLTKPFDTRDVLKLLSQILDR
jgi:DNA-binding response OmpR family regulator